MKSRKTFLLLAVIVLTMITACTQKYDSESDFEVFIKDGESVIITEYVGSKQKVRIPPRIQNLPVTEIGGNIFKDAPTSPTRVTIPDSATIIGIGAFANWTNLTSVTIPDSVTLIFMAAFLRSGLTSVTIPNSVTAIHTSAFAQCTNLTSVSFQGMNTGLEKNALEGDLREKYLAGGIGTYTTTAPVNENSIWTKQSGSGNKSVSAGKSSGSVSAFSGRWQLIEGRGDAKDVELFKDGTGTADGYGITWKIENGRFYILHPWYTFSAFYNVTGSTVTFTKDNGDVVKYQKR